MGTGSIAEVTRGEHVFGVGCLGRPARCVGNFDKPKYDGVEGEWGNYATLLSACDTSLERLG